MINGLNQLCALPILSSFWLESKVVSICAKDVLVCANLCKAHATIASHEHILQWGLFNKTLDVLVL